MRDSSEADLDRFEGIGALNFLAIDDLAVVHEGELLDPRSVIALPVNVDLPVLPAFEHDRRDPFVVRVGVSGKKWVILTDDSDQPLLVLDADGFLRAVLFSQAAFNPYSYCHRPVVVRDGRTPLGEVIRQLRVQPSSADDDVIDNDLILLWNNEKRVITGADLLGRIFRGIVPIEQ